MSAWTEADEDVKPRPSSEEHEADLRRAWVVALGALSSGHDVSRGQPGRDGRCIEHRIRGCRCGMISPGPHGAGAGRAGADDGEGAGAPDEQNDARPGPVPAVVAGAGVVPGPARGDGFSYWTFDPVREVWRSSTSEPMCCEDGCREPGAVLIAGLLYCTKHAATEYCRWPVLSPCPRGECRDCDENEEA